MPLAETLARSTAGGKMSSQSSSLVADRFHQLPHVVSARAGDATVLMDRKRGIYFTLNEVGGRVWELVGDGATGSDIVERLLEEYDVGREQLGGDVAVTLRQLVRDRLIGSGPNCTSGLPERQTWKLITQAAVSREFRVPSVLGCGLIIFVLKVMLKMRGLDWTINWIRQRVMGVPLRTDVNLEAIKATEQQVAMAGALYPGRALCLEQSLALWHCLRRRGISADLHLGVHAHPFRAHAWVEYSDVILNDFEERVRHFHTLQKMGL